VIAALPPPKPKPEKRPKPEGKGTGKRLKISKGSKMYRGPTPLSVRPILRPVETASEINFSRLESIFGIGQVAVIEEEEEEGESSEEEGEEEVAEVVDVDMEGVESSMSSPVQPKVEVAMEVAMEIDSVQDASPPPPPPTAAAAPPTAAAPAAAPAAEISPGLFSPTTPGVRRSVREGGVICNEVRRLCAQIGLQPRPFLM